MLVGPEEKASGADSEHHAEAASRLGMKEGESE